MQMRSSYVVVASLLTALLAACSGDQGPAAPPYTETSRQGIIRAVVVAPDVARDADQLWRIAEDLRGSAQAVQVMFWTDKAQAPAQLPPTIAQLRTQVAQISVNGFSGQRELRPLNGHSFAATKK
jgi:hypothetical protein